MGGFERAGRATSTGASAADVAPSGVSGASGASAGKQSLTEGLAAFEHAGRESPAGGMSKGW